MLGNTLRKTASLAAAAAVATGGLVALSSPAEAATTYKIKIYNLWCESTEDWTGADEPYITVNGSKVWSGSLNDRQGVTINVTKSSSNTTRVKLYDADAGFFDNDDFLGEFAVNLDHAGQGLQEAHFAAWTADYTMYYEVVR
ncbi:hypothetical protein [Motilibacter deserti]|uniref:Uncharacterized protein n=1 Tax=Motilibacter deserti TaxID=2714956 RepID=A0ABX0GUF0_9ACTN|nr:hypothetical protein [Motilibacter deserti]NHC14531.1 hypothetical protein [Motilibacter deserti]